MNWDPLGRETVERLRSDGVAIANEPHVIFTDTDGTFGPAGAEEWMAFITDSEGNLVGLASVGQASVGLASQSPADA